MKFGLFLIWTLISSLLIFFIALFINNFNLQEKDFHYASEKNGITIFYRLKNNECKPIAILSSESTEKDFASLSECQNVLLQPEENSQNQNKISEPNKKLKILVVSAAIIVCIFIIIILIKLLRSNDK